MKLNISEVEYSINDIKNNIKIPTEINEDLAEFIGIMVGDGHIGRYLPINSKYSYVHYQIEISGNIKDRNYYMGYVNNLIFRVFNIKFNFKERKKDSSSILRKDSKAIYHFLSKVIGIPQRKDNVLVPKCILENDNKIKAAFIRGLADADFCLTAKSNKNNYPVIKGTSKSEKLIIQCSNILKDLGMDNIVCQENNYSEKRNKTYINHNVYLNGDKKVAKFAEVIGFGNSLRLKLYNKIMKKRTRWDLNS